MAKKRLSLGSISEQVSDQFNDFIYKKGDTELGILANTFNINGLYRTRVEEEIVDLAPIIALEGDGNYEVYVTADTDDVEWGNEIIVEAGTPVATNYKLVGTFSISGSVLVESSVISNSLKGNSDLNESVSLLESAAYKQNYLINPELRFAQRGITFSVSGAEVYTVDRWKVNCPDGSDNVDVDQVAFGTEIPLYLQTMIPMHPRYYLKLSKTGTNNIFMLKQPIEGVETLAGRRVSGSFWMISNQTEDITIKIIRHSSGDDESFTVDTFSPNGGYGSTNIFEKVEWSYDLPTLEGSGHVADADSYIEFRIEFTSAAQDIRIVQFQLNEGNRVYDFQRRLEGLEESFCQRYFQKLFYGGDGGDNIISPSFTLPTAPSGSQNFFSLQFAQVPRIAEPLVIFNNWTASTFKFVYEGSLYSYSSGLARLGSFQQNICNFRAFISVPHNNVSGILMQSNVLEISVEVESEL